jgi:hypothetical protein
MCYAIKEYAGKIYHQRGEFLKGDIYLSDRKANGIARQGGRHSFE